MNVLEPLYKKFRDAYLEKSLGFYIKNFFKIRKRHIEITQNKKYPQIVCDAYLTNVNLKNVEMDGYLASTVQFGFIVLFSVAFPVAPILALLHNLLQRKIDSLNILTRYKRPFSIQARNIGIWERWLTALSFFGVAMNASIIAFTSTYFEEAYLSYYGPEDRWIGRLVFILVFEHSVLLILLAVVFFSPSMPNQVKVSISRQEYVEKLMRGEESFVDPEILEVNLESVKID